VFAWTLDNIYPHNTRLTLPDRLNCVLMAFFPDRLAGVGL